MNIVTFKALAVSSINQAISLSGSDNYVVRTHRVRQRNTSATRSNNMTCKKTTVNERTNKPLFLIRFKSIR